MKLSIKHFDLSDFASRTDAGAWANMRVGTVLKLDMARELYKAPIVISHAFRTPADVIRLKKQGYEVAANSAHELGYAVDIQANLGTDIEAWKKLLDALWGAGFRRFGIMRGAIHVDDDPKRTAPAVWKYSTTSPQVWVWAQSWMDKKREQAS